MPVSPMASLAAPIPALATRPLQPLSDQHSAALQGGRRGSAGRGRSSCGPAAGSSGTGGFGSGGFGLMAMVQSMLLNVSQLNFSFNIALNGSTIQTTQLNGLTLDASV